MHTQSAGIFGASGYAGVELTRLLAAHPSVQLAFVSGESWRGQAVADRVGAGVSGPASTLRYLGVEEGLARAMDVDAVLLATPAEASMALAAPLAARGVRVVDLSAAFRLRDGAVFEAAYGHQAPAAEQLAGSVYGLPELSRAAIAGTRLVANPGCYPTAAALALGPLLRAGAIEPGDLVVDAMSGVTGAGRRAEEAYSFGELYGNARAYKVLAHQHTPEIAQTLAHFAGLPTAAIDLTFTAHLIPVARGILSTGYARLRAGAAARTSAELTALLRQAYEGEPFVRVLDRPEDVSLHQVQGTNVCTVGVACQPSTSGKGGRVVVVSALDNLLKGAAGQAVQNMNLVLGLDERAGLTDLARSCS
jgi:N-acetyl-gamma-glutamyl-phosphate reductase